MDATPTGQVTESDSSPEASRFDETSAATLPILLDRLRAEMEGPEVAGVCPYCGQPFHPAAHMETEPCSLVSALVDRIAVIIEGRGVAGLNSPGSDEGMAGQQILRVSEDLEVAGRFHVEITAATEIQGTFTTGSSSDAQDAFFQELGGILPTIMAFDAGMMESRGGLKGTPPRWRLKHSIRTFCSRWNGEGWLAELVGVTETGPEAQP